MNWYRQYSSADLTQNDIEELKKYPSPEFIDKLLDDGFKLNTPKISLHKALEHILNKHMS